MYGSKRLFRLINTRLIKHGLALLQPKRVPTTTAQLLEFVSWGHDPKKHSGTKLGAVSAYHRRSALIQCLGTLSPQSPLFCCAQARVASDYWFPHLPAVLAIAKSQCPQCRLYCKKPIQTPPKPIIATSVGERIIIDLTERHPDCHNGHRYILTASDCLSRYKFAESLPDKSGPTVAAAFGKVLNTIVNGPHPKKVKFVQSDRGSEFRCSDFVNMCALYHVDRQILMGPYNPRANGQIESFNKHINRELDKIPQAPDASGRPRGTSWSLELQGAIDTYNITPHSVTACAPYTLWTGCLPPRLGQPMPSTSLNMISKEELSGLEKRAFDANFSSSQRTYEDFTKKYGPERTVQDGSLVFLKCMSTSAANKRMFGEHTCAGFIVRRTSSTSLFTVRMLTPGFNGELPSELAKNKVPFELLRVASSDSSPTVAVNEWMRHLLSINGNNGEPTPDEEASFQSALKFAHDIESDIVHALQGYDDIIPLDLNAGESEDRILAVRKVSNKYELLFVAPEEPLSEAYWLRLQDISLESQREWKIKIADIKIDLSNVFDDDVVAWLQSGANPEAVAALKRGPMPRSESEITLMPKEHGRHFF